MAVDSIKLTLLSASQRARGMSVGAKAALASVMLAGLVVMLGAWTRLVDAGLGCPDWPGCYGFWSVPTEQHEIALAEQRFPNSPVEAAKGWPEMIHRYFAGTLGLVILGLTLLAYSRRNQSPEWRLPRAHVLGLLILVSCQAAFGMWTVTLKLWPQVVATHLLGGFATLSLLFLLFLRLRFPAYILLDYQLSRVAKRLRPVLWFSFVLLLGQIFLGAWTAANYAALACGSELPTCQGSAWPEMDFASGFNLLQSIGPNYLGGQLEHSGRVAIHVSHRAGAVLLCVGLLYLLWRLRPLRSVGELKWAQALVAAALLVQMLLGVSNIIWLVPLPVAVAHNAGGAVLLLSLVNLAFQLRRIEAKPIASDHRYFVSDKLGG